MQKGLSTNEALQLLKTVGENSITVTKNASPLSLFLSQFPTVINAVLTLGSLFSLLIGDVLDALFIAAILLLNAIVGFIQEYRAERSLEKLTELVVSQSRVIRDGKEQQIKTTDIVPQDIVVLSEGDRIPADGTVTTAHMEVDESLLTGESFPLAKTGGDAVFSGTLVTYGNGRLLVEKTGMQTRFGNIAQKLATVEPDRTPLQQKLDELGKLVSAVAVLTAILLIPIGRAHGQSFIPLVLLSVSAAIAAIPEGLPAVVTVALAIATNRMAKKNAIVRKMAVVETLGSIQILLIDKTGTITTNNMRVKKSWVQNHKEQLLFAGCIFGNSASILEKATKGTFDIVGDKTDAALLLFAKEQVSVESVQKEATVIEEFSFNPETKTITCVVKKGAEIRVFVRGAPETILSHSKLTKSERQQAERMFSAYANEGLRVVAFATKKEQRKITSRGHLEKDLEFLGFVGIYDPPREGAHRALQEAKRAGIHTVMVTGDNELTAMTIAKEVGLIEKDEDVITGEDLEKITDEELKNIVMKTRIFARTTPEHKLRIVSIFKELGFIVGVTGDGVNDAIALKRADVGIAMGNLGTDVAKEASDIILTDDNISTLVAAVEEGRTIYNNILTAITYLLTGNLSEITFILFSAAFGFPMPFLPTQILWINIITDGLPALALASDVKDGRSLEDPPRDAHSPILSRFRLFSIFIIGTSLGLSLLFTYRLLLSYHSETFARILVFNMLLFIHLVMVFAIRGKSLFRMNRFLFLSVLISVLAQIAVNIFPLFKVIFGFL